MKDGGWTANLITSTATELVGGDRAITHGDKVENHEKIAALWNAILVAADKRPPMLLDAHDVANMMEALKIARRYCGAFNIDDYIDASGYAAVAGEIKSREMDRERAIHTWAAAAIEGFPAGADPAVIRTNTSRAGETEARRDRR